MVGCIVPLATNSWGAISVDSVGQFRNSWDVGAGMVLPRRDSFRDLYGNGIGVTIGYERLTGRFTDYELRFCATKAANEQLRNSYWNLSLSPIFNHAFITSRRFRIYAGLGTGISHRRIAYDVINGAQSELSVYVVASSGIQYRVRRLALTFRAMFDRHLTGEPGTGDFGDTGGFSFLLTVGRRF